MLTNAERQHLMGKIQHLPGNLEVAVKGLNENQLDTPYREDGWTIRQVVHHLADSHLNGFVRMKLILTEDRPTLKPYDQNTWAQTADVIQIPILSSLVILKGLHALECIVREVARVELPTCSISSGAGGGHAR